jgi:hypothetical protein
MNLPEHSALRVLSAIRRGSSWPVIVHTQAGDFVTKLRGAAQGLAPLVAEIIVGELATELGIPVPERALIVFEEDLPSDDANDELADLLSKSRGLNLGFRFLPGALDLTPNRLDSVPADLAARILWLDALVENPDRTPQSPNILLWHGQPWLIDHGAALNFHYDWRAVTEDSPREAAIDLRSHLLFARAGHLLRETDVELAPLLTRAVLSAAASRVPDEFLRDAFGGEAPERLRAAYVAFLWKRLKAPRPFLGD